MREVQARLAKSGKKKKDNAGSSKMFNYLEEGELTNYQLFIVSTPALICISRCIFIVIGTSSTLQVVLGLK
jgi:hypothetical protein